MGDAGCDWTQHAQISGQQGYGQLGGEQRRGPMVGYASRFTVLPTSPPIRNGPQTEKPVGACLDLTTRQEYAEGQGPLEGSPRSLLVATKVCCNTKEGYPIQRVQEAQEW